ncbi:hypothetical protein NDU88_007773 [Pleurodeles waltl]|uniref:Uncharacterized protein n=1 Tax=Pleurodeles waltl TaxID=8319 RepID=A0AAV7PUG5_PLEWA|nr:hypothetical protein NDU88_007773 [Pleurodeles waltl]
MTGCMQWYLLVEMVFMGKFLGHYLGWDRGHEDLMGLLYLPVNIVNVLKKALVVGLCEVRQIIVENEEEKCEEVMEDLGSEADCRIFYSEEWAFLLESETEP